MNRRSNRRPADRLAELRAQHRAIGAEINELRAGFIAGELPLQGDEHEVWLDERRCFDLARLRAEMGEAFVERFMTKPVTFVRVITMFE